MKDDEQDEHDVDHRRDVGLDLDGGSSVRHGVHRAPRRVGVPTRMPTADEASVSEGLREHEAFVSVCSSGGLAQSLGERAAETNDPFDRMMGP